MRHGFKGLAFIFFLLGNANIFGQTFLIEKFAHNPIRLTPIRIQFPPETEAGETDLELIQPGQELRIEWATIGDPYNPPVNGIGSVHYTYQISRFEITNHQYAIFLNAVAAFDDPNNLYTPAMHSSVVGGIVRRLSREKNRFEYLVKLNMKNKPVNFIGWHQAARFVNWLENGQPQGGQNSSTTEDGAYALTKYFSYGMSARNPRSVFGLPSEDEWYKAAFYDPSIHSNHYWTFATRRNYSDQPQYSEADARGNLVDGPQANLVNYNEAANWNGTESGNVVSVGSAGPQSESYYGVSDLHGNVAEWTEEVICPRPPAYEGDPNAECGRFYRGGDYTSNDDSGRAYSGLLVVLAPVRKAADGENSPRWSRVGFRIVRSNPLERQWRSIQGF